MTREAFARCKQEYPQDMDIYDQTKRTGTIGRGRDRTRRNQPAKHEQCRMRLPRYRKTIRVRPGLRRCYWVTILSTPVICHAILFHGSPSTYTCHICHTSHDAMMGLDKRYPTAPSLVAGLSRADRCTTQPPLKEDKRNVTVDRSAPRHC